MTDSRGNSTTYVYDVLDRLTEETDPLGNSSVMTYDEVGNLLSLSSADGTTTYDHDANNRVIEVTFPDATTAAFGYDANGNRTSIADTAGTTALAYDVLNRIASVTDPFNLTIGYTYDASGNRNSIIYPGNRPVTYLYDPIGRLVQVRDWSGVATTYSYDGAGRLTLEVLGNGDEVAYEYDGAGRLTGKEDRTATGVVLASYDYVLDPNGNRYQATLIQPLVTGGEIANQLYSHDQGNRVLTDNSRTFTYDGNGSRISVSDGANTSLYEYDYNDRLTRISGGELLREYAYASDGTRLRATRDGEETRYLVDRTASMDIILGEFDTTNSPRRFYVHGQGLLYSIDGQTGVRSYYHFDPVGSTVAIVDASGQVLNSYAYLPFGELADSVETSTNLFTYVGRLGVMYEADGLYFMRARFYDSSTRSFLTQDSVVGDLEDPVTLNQYLYAGGNPLSRADPDGESFKDFLSGVAYVAGLFSTGTSVHSAASMPSLDRAIGATVSTIVSAIDTALLTVGRANPITGLAGEAIHFGRGARQGFVDQSYEAEASGGHFFGYIAGSWASCLRSNVACNRNRSPGTLSTLKGAIAALPGGASVVAYQSLASSGAMRTSGVGTGPVASATGAALATAEPAAAAAALPPKRRRPKTYLTAAVFAGEYYEREFALILAPDFLDQRTRSDIERGVSQEIASLQSRKYKYRVGDREGKREALERRASDVASGAGRLYAQLVSELSKHHVVVRDMSELPRYSTRGFRKAGVFGGN